MRLNDTQPEGELILINLLRETPIWRKLELMCELNDTAQMLALGDLRTQYPRATEEELRRRLADRILGTELAAQVYGPLIA